MLRHPLAEVRWERCVLERLDEEHGDIDGAAGKGQLIVVVDLAGAVPVYCCGSC
jgi:hypothetical protein